MYTYISIITYEFIIDSQEAEKQKTIYPYFFEKFQNKNFFQNFCILNIFKLK